MEPSPIALCAHDAPTAAARVCPHLLAMEAPPYHRRFNGRGLLFDYLCDACARDGAAFDPSRLAPMCLGCETALLEHGYWAGVVGEPEILTRPSGLRFESRVVRLLGLPAEPLLDLQPINALSRSVWIALSADFRLWRLDLTDDRCDALGTPPPSSLDLSEPVSLAIDQDGRFAAIVNAKGRYGLVLDLETLQPVLNLDRGDYHNEHCRYSIAFFTPKGGGDPLLVHASAWNRLEISDPRSGRLLTPRDAMEYRDVALRPEHYLDYFHCGLAVSPDGAWIADNGWIWHPMGAVRSWSLEAWLRDNAFESEDGASVQTLCMRGYYWDGPLCWIGDETLAVGGFGEDDEWLLHAAVRLFDVVSGEEFRWFAGPLGDLYFDERLFACSSEAGVTVWDVETGERLHHAPDLHPTRYHSGAREFCAPTPDGGFQLSRLIDQDAPPIKKS